MIHQYKLNGYNIVLDISSGAVHAVDDLAYDVIALVDELGPDLSREKVAESIVAPLLAKYADDPDVTAQEIESVYKEVEGLRVPSCGAQLQLKLQLLLCQPGQVPRRARPHEL